MSGDTRVEDLEAELQSIASHLPREVLMTIEEQLIERGKVEGKEEGKEEGRLEGTIQEKQEVLQRLAEKKFGALDDHSRQTILATRDPAKLDRAIDLILDAYSVEEVLGPLR